MSLPTNYYRIRCLLPCSEDKARGMISLLPPATRRRYLSVTPAGVEFIAQVLWADPALARAAAEMTFRKLIGIDHTHTVIVSKPESVRPTVGAAFAAV